MIFDISLLLLTVALRGVSNKHCLLPLFSLIFIFLTKPHLFLLCKVKFNDVTITRRYFHDDFPPNFLLQIIAQCCTYQGSHIQLKNIYSSSDNCPMLHIPGFTYPVKEYKLEDVIETLR